MFQWPQMLTDFDFFMDEDVRSQRIGILCLEKILTPALTQALFRVKEKAQAYHEKRIHSFTLKEEDKKAQIKSTQNQLREVKWSELNLMRSFIAHDFLQNFFHYCCKGPLPIMFFNTPFKGTHKDSIAHFFNELPQLKIPDLKDMQNSNSVFFLDTFTTVPGFRFEEIVRDSNNLSRCFRIDSRAHDIMQLTDVLLGVTVYRMFKKKTQSSAKLRAVKGFETEYNHAIKKGTYNDNKCIYYIS